MKRRTKMDAYDRELGMDRKIARRDFLNGVAVAVGGSLVAPSWLEGRGLRPAAQSGGQAAGGDKRGRQSAALLVVRAGAGYGGFNDRYRDLRVDDHPTPIKELKRIYELHRKIFRPPRR